MDLAAYLGRIGYYGSRAATRAVLAEVVALKLVGSGRGGWCFEQNLLLGNALQALGFEVTDLRERLVMPQPLANFEADGMHEPEPALLRQMYDTNAVFMMGQNPNLPVMPERPRLLDFFHYRFNDIVFHHLLQSAKLALDAGQSETVIIACLLHDISNGALIRSDHGFGARR